MAFGVSHDRLDAIRRQFKLFGDFGYAHAIVKVVDDRADWHPRTAQTRQSCPDKMMNGF